MQSYATIEEFSRFKTVTYFTLKGEDSTLSETDDFFLRMKKELDYPDQLQRLAAWLRNIGNDKDGADFDLFRHERQSWTKQLNNTGIETDGKDILNLHDLYIKY